MNTNTLENRYINKVGLSNIFNEGLRALIKQQAYSLFRMKTEDITEDFWITAALHKLKWHIILLH